MNATSITSDQVDVGQGYTEDGSPFGFVAGDDGGFFFTWGESLAKTLETIEEDSESSDGGLIRADVVDFLRAYLPTTSMGKNKWS